MISGDSKSINNRYVWFDRIASSEKGWKSMLHFYGFL